MKDDVLAAAKAIASRQRVSAGTVISRLLLAAISGTTGTELSSAGGPRPVAGFQPFPSQRPTARVAQRLAMACAAPEHAFWPADVNLLASDLIDWQRLLGHRQVTDAYLLALAVRNNGRLVTLDQRISRDIVMGAKPSHLELIV